MKPALLTKVAIHRSMLFCCLFTLLSLLLNVTAHAQTNTKTIKIFSPPDGAASDSVLVWVHADSTVHKISSSALGSPWFYMPAFNLPLGAADGTTVYTYNLYQEYVNQFTGATAGQFFKSDTSTQVITPYPASQLVFYVTRYSSNVITVTGIDSDGTLHYTVNSSTVPDGSFITIIFKVKQ